MEKYSLWKRFVVWAYGRAKLEKRQLPGWKAPSMFYVAKCPLHGYFEDSLHGYREYMNCPECLKESVEYGATEIK